MKNKKLFAILTLVCFMFTLMPVAAFAADAYVTVNDDEKATVEVGEGVEVAVSTGSGYRFFAVDEDGDLDQIAEKDAEEISFDEVGTYKVYALAETDAEAIDKATMTKAAKLELLMESDSLVEDYATVKVKASDLEYQIVLADNNDEENASFDYVAAKKAYVVTIANNDGWNKDGNLKATLQKRANADAEWEDVKDADLTFTTAGYVDVVTEDGTTTDRGGDVEFEVVSDRTGEYSVIVKYGTKAKAELKVTVQAETVGNVEVVNAPKAPVDLDQDAQAADIEFKFTDANGRAFEPAVDNTNVVKVVVVEKPADSTVEDGDFYLVKEVADDATTEDEVEGTDPENDEAGVYTLAGEFDEEGEYTIKVTLKNGKSAEVTVKVLEQGDIVGIKFDVYNTPRTVAYDGATQVNKVLAFDANGVTKAVALEDGVKFSANGSAIETFYANGTVMTKDDEDYIGSKITVMAAYDDFIATTELTVVDKAATIKYANLTAEVGVNTTLEGTVVDNNGSASSIAKQATNWTALVLDKPADAVAVVDVEVTEKGKVLLHFLASEAGEYKVQTTVTYGANNSFISSIDTITVGGVAGEFKDIVVVSLGADKMIVNSEVVALDVAPFIENNRTMMQFNVLYVFGIDVEWVAETQSIVAEGNGLKVVMQLGSKVATVNGAEVALDVAPYTVNGRTVVPVGFITGLLDITPTFTYNADGTIADILFTK